MGVRLLDPDEPYDGPIKAKDKVQKVSIDDLDSENEEAPNDKDQSVLNGTVKGSGGKGFTSHPTNMVKVADLNKFADRTHTCNELTGKNVGEKVVLCGWLEYQRMGKFLILRDSYGQTQVLLTDKVKGVEKFTDGNIPLETIVRVEGTVIPRPASTVNPKMSTGHIEIEAEKVDILNLCKNMPFVVRKFNRASERLRLAHRYIDLR